MVGDITVKELVARLNQFDGDLPALIVVEGDEYTISTVEHETNDNIILITGEV